MTKVERVTELFLIQYIGIRSEALTKKHETQYSAVSGGGLEQVTSSVVEWSEFLYSSRVPGSIPGAIRFSEK
jgi:hypothetical protein